MASEQNHPFGTDRHDAFRQRARGHRSLAKEVQASRFRAAASMAELTVLPHTRLTSSSFNKSPSSRRRVFWMAATRQPFRGMFEAASSVVGATLVAVEALMSGTCRRAFVPIAGLHHAARDRCGRDFACSMIAEWRSPNCLRDAIRHANASRTSISMPIMATVCSTRSKSDPEPWCSPTSTRMGAIFILGLVLVRRKRGKRYAAMPAASSICRCAPGAGDAEFLTAWSTSGNSP